MSVIRSKYLRRAGSKAKSEHRKIRRYAKGFVKANRRYAVNDYCFKLGLNNAFMMQSSTEG
ncbi:hypothetical protein BC792_12750 [Sphingobacterium allocomposti]|uniref:Uncharacterized protein n=1 Tax=Sphingobacterium allocomposti TaxID=415956 RepID=A0A5S5D452_9SPHI|nr:hypothetical protein BC792_12750 [Sphingobacterium composti Yoo et al. 2007 non Ten et al. 2007]